jgi:hypothetical protein
VSAGVDGRRYIRAVESAWSKVLGRPAVISPREFEAIDAWRRRGIPLAVVLEVIADSGRRGSGRAPKALTALARAVEESWSVVAAGRAAPDRAGSLPPRTDVRRAWENALGRCPEGAPLRELLFRLLAQEAAGESGALLDAALDAALPDAVRGDSRARASDETTRALAEFRPRMSEGEYRTLFARALADRLRAALHLPRLALTR